MNIIIIAILSVCIICMISLIVFEIILCVSLNRMKSIINDQSRMIYTMDKQIRYLQTTTHDTQETITSLSTSVVSAIQESSKPKYIYPDPDLVDKITKTVIDLISMEMILSKDMQYPPRESTNMIVQATLKTYPHVHPDYLIKKTLSIIESYSKSN